MTDATLKIILDNVPTIIGAILAGAATIISTFALRKGNENGLKADIANTKADAIAEKTDDIHQLADGNFHRVSQELQAANESIAKLQNADVSEVVSILARHQGVLNRMDVDILDLAAEVKAVRKRQHDLANFLNEMGLKYQLQPIPKGPDDAS